MKKFRPATPVLALCAALCLVAPPARAAGINLSWNDYGTSGQSLATSYCNTNVGTQSMVISFVSPVPMTQFVGFAGVMDVMFNSATVPSWWMGQNGGCRPLTFNFNSDFSAGPFSCGDLWSGSIVGATNLSPGVPAANRLRIRFFGAVPSNEPRTIDDVTQYYLVKIAINNLKTVGAGSCGGCDIAACILLNQIELDQPAGVGDYVITQPLDNVLVGWQCPAVYGTPEPQCFACPVPAKKNSWGGIKQLFR